MTRVYITDLEEKILLRDAGLLMYEQCELTLPTKLPTANRLWEVHYLEGTVMPYKDVSLPPDTYSEDLGYFINVEE